eukprot:1143996-Pelagomonas_calceolata.AAC.1
MKAACSLGDCRGLSFFAACLKCLRMKSGCRVVYWGKKQIGCPGPCTSEHTNLSPSSARWHKCGHHPTDSNHPGAQFCHLPTCRDPSFTQKNPERACYQRHQHVNIMHSPTTLNGQTGMFKEGYRNKISGHGGITVTMAAMGCDLQPARGRLCSKTSKLLDQLGCKYTDFALLHVAARLLLVLLNGAGLAAAHRECLGQTQGPDQLHQVSVPSGTRHLWHKARDKKSSAKPQWKLEQMLIKREHPRK